MGDLLEAKDTFEWKGIEFELNCRSSTYKCGFKQYLHLCPSPREREMSTLETVKISTVLPFSDNCVYVLVHSGYYNKMPQTRWLINNRNVFLIFLVTGKSKI